MSFSDGVLAGSVMSTLREPAVSMVNFKVLTFQIGTMHYLTIAAMINSGSVKCKVDASQLPNGASAIWDNGVIYSGKAEGFYADEKSVFVHECTHAIIQTLAGVSPGGAMKVKALNNEVTAYLAGSIYIKASGQQVSFKDPRSPAASASKIVDAKDIGTTPTNAGSPIVFTAAEIAPLITSIKASPLYADWNQDSELRKFW